MAAVNMDKVVQAYNAIRDARAARRRVWEVEDLELEKDQQVLKALLLDTLNKSGAKSMTTGHGTAYRREVLKPGAADWGAIWDWVKAHDAPELFERRLKVGFIKDYMEQNGGAVPPGINVHREFEVSVRRAGSTPTSDDGE